MKQKVIIIGGGAAGFFAAITMAELNPNLEITILEKSKSVLQKVKVSGGGRCNVTHACFTPQELIEFYPRGKKELLGPFHQFMTGDTMAWFEDRGVPLKIEEDNRVFPVSNSSQSIIDCLVSNAIKLGVSLVKQTNVLGIEMIKDKFKVYTNKDNCVASKLLIATGSSSKVWRLIENLGHHIIPPVPSLFTFNITDHLIKDIPGISVPNATVKLVGSNLKSHGPLLITHWGLSGPAVLKLSAFAARELAEKNYTYTVEVNWLGQSFEMVQQRLTELKTVDAKKNIDVKSPYREMPRRLWLKLLDTASIDHKMRWADLPQKQIAILAGYCTGSTFKAEGKSTFKEEFVTAGGVDLREINFKRFESKIHNNLFFAGEVLNIDAVTGGFNFQNAWTGGYIAGKAIAEAGT